MTFSILNRLSVESLSIDTPLSPAQIETDHILCTFADEASNWKSLASMTLGGMAYRAGRMAALRLIGNTFGSIQKIPFFVNTLSHLSGLCSEVSIFTLSHRSIETLTSQNSSHALWKWKGEEGLIKDWANSFINFGILRLFGKMGEGKNPILHHFIQDSGMVLGQNIAYHFGITSKPQGELLQQFVHAEAVNLQMIAGMSLAHFTTGGRISQIERNLDLEIKANTFALRNNQNSFIPSFHSTFETQAQAILYSTTTERVGGGRSYPQTNLEVSNEELRKILGQCSIIDPKDTLENAFTRGKLLAAAARSVYLKHPSSDKQSALLQIHRMAELAYTRLDFEMLKAYRDEIDPETKRYFNMLIPFANKSAKPEDRLFSLDEMELDLPGARVVPRIDHIRINFTTQFEGNTSRTVPETRDLLTAESSKVMALAFINTFKNRMSALKLSLHMLRKFSQLPTLSEIIHQGSADDKMNRALSTLLKVLQEATEYKRILSEDKGLYQETFLQNVFFYEGYNLKSDYLFLYETILELNPELRQSKGIEEMPTLEEIISQIPEQRRRTP